MKAILMPIRPVHAAKALNGYETDEIHRTAPKEWVDYLSGKIKEKPKPMTAYIYCTKKGGLMRDVTPATTYFISSPVGPVTSDKSKRLEGKVVAKFTLSDIEKVHYDGWSDHFYIEKNDVRTDVLSTSGLTYKALKDYYFRNEFKMRCYAYHISDLVIFDKPKELSEFKHPFPYCGRYCDNNLIPSFCKDHCSHNTDPERLDVWRDRYDKWGEPLNKAPQSWCYVEVIE